MSRDFAAPINLEWGRDNRTTGLRVPVSEPSEARRLENRLAGMDVQPLSRDRGQRLPAGISA
jgi:glutamine synthetase